MFGDGDGSPGDLMEPDVEQARRSALMAHGLVAKLQRMGLPESLHEELAALSTDLGDLWGAQKALSDHLEELLQSPEDWETVGDYLVDLRAAIDHIRWHVGSVRRPMSRITRCAYSKASEQKGGPPLGGTK